MGSLIKRTDKTSARSNKTYSLPKQAKWHYVGEGNAQPVPKPLGIGERVKASLYCHVESTSVVIP